MDYTIGTTVMGKWKIIDDLGEGANARVFLVSKTECGVEVTSALKVIRIPRSISDVKEALSEGLDEDSVKEYFQEIVNDLIREVALMASLKSHPNIVGYEDHEVIPLKGRVGWDILIRMEQLTSLPDYLLTTALSEADVIDLGIQLTEALVHCQEKGIIHRDIKPKNIFVNAFGQYKLGDFGVARTLDQTKSGLSRSGTEGYMAPEVYLNRPYGITVDIYSLGLVLYSLMNGNRLPFWPAAPKKIGYTEKMRALERRMEGEALPPPTHASAAFSEVILRACAFESKDRYRTARELQEALRQLKRNRYSDQEESYEESKRTEPVLFGALQQDADESFAHAEDEPTYSVWSHKSPASKTKRSGKLSKGWIAAAVSLCAILLGVIFWAGSGTRDGWVERGEKTYYYIDGKKAKGLVSIDSSEYYFDRWGVMQTGQVVVGDITYYLDADGSLLYANVTKTEIGTSRSEEAISIDDRDIYARVLEQPVENVISLSVEIEVTEVRDGEPDGDRRVYVRTLDGEWVLVGTLTVSELHGRAEIDLESPLSFDAFVCPEVDSAFSGSVSQTLTEVVCRIDTLGKCKNGHQWNDRENGEEKICLICGEIKSVLFVVSPAFEAWTIGTEEPVYENENNRIHITWDAFDQDNGTIISIQDCYGERVEATNFSFVQDENRLTICPQDSLDIGHYILDVTSGENSLQFGVLYGDENEWYLALEDLGFSRETHVRHVASGAYLSVENEQLMLDETAVKVFLDQMKIIQTDERFLVAPEGAEEDRVICYLYVSTEGEQYLLKYRDQYLAAAADGSGLYLSETLTKECWWY